VTIDLDEKKNPTIVGDMRHWGDAHTVELQSRFPERFFIVHGSPPCTDYSAANTTAKRPREERLTKADELVKSLLCLFYKLGDRGLVLTVENPGTGRLVNRAVSVPAACLHLH
jgi:hypothetical protein